MTYLSAEYLLLSNARQTDLLKHCFAKQSFVSY